MLLLIYDLCIKNTYNYLCLPRSCFEAYVTHKFRSTIGKNRPVPVGTAVLVAVSGGISSLATLRMVHAAVTNPTNKRLRWANGRAA